MLVESNAQVNISRNMLATCSPAVVTVEQRTAGTYSVLRIKRQQFVRWGSQICLLNSLRRVFIVFERCSYELK